MAIASFGTFQLFRLAAIRSHVEWKDIGGCVLRELGYNPGSLMWLSPLGELDQESDRVRHCFSCDDVSIV